MPSSDNFSDEQLLALNARGLIPGPDEDSREFSQRVQACLEKIVSFPIAVEAQTTAADYPSVLAHVEKLFKTKPDWVNIVYSDSKLCPWHGAMTWIFPKDTESPVFIQLRKAFRHLQVYLKLYKKEELMAHELVHASRMAFNESQFEEMLAYRTSSSLSRRWLGCLFATPLETAVFAGTICLTWISAFFSFALENTMFWLAPLLPPLLLLLSGLRLCHRSYLWHRCKQKLQKLLSNPSFAEAVIFRLTDAEIHTFALIPPNKISGYIQKQTSLRWRVISLAYFV